MTLLGAARFSAETLQSAWGLVAAGHWSAGVFKAGPLVGSLSASFRLRFCSIYGVAFYGCHVFVRAIMISSKYQRSGKRTALVDEGLSVEFTSNGLPVRWHCITCTPFSHKLKKLGS